MSQKFFGVTMYCKNKFKNTSGLLSPYHEAADSFRQNIIPPWTFSLHTLLLSVNH